MHTRGHQSVRALLLLAVGVAAIVGCIDHATDAPDHFHGGGGVLAAGGSGTGGGAGTGGSEHGSGSGGIDSDACSGRYPGNPNCGGAGGGAGSGGSYVSMATGGTRTGSGGSPTTGGNANTGGLPSTVGTAGKVGTGGIPTTVGTGGTLSSSGGTAGARPTGGVGGGGGTPSNTLVGSGGVGGKVGACSCTFGNPATTTLDCFCSRYTCVDNQSAFASTGRDGGLAFETVLLYQDCKLVVIKTITTAGRQDYAYDLDTGALVGASYTSDVAKECPWLPDVGFGTLAAGRFPEAGCTISRCSNGTQPLAQPCPDAGP